MFQHILNAVIPVAVTALAAVLTAAVKAVGSQAVSFLERKKQALELSMGTDTYNRNLAFAKSAWQIVDEYFRITPNLEKTAEAKQQMFAQELKKFVPSLTDAEIAQLRQTVAGEINRAKAVVTAPAPQ